MFNPKFRIPITLTCFPQDEFICLGTQLASIVHSIKSFLPEHIWYGADVDAMGKGAAVHNLRSLRPNLIGSDAQFIAYCSTVTQFVWGEFLCFDSKAVSAEIGSVELETEDPPFRPIGCNGILIEIRAFDTSWFELYSEDWKLMTKLAQLYHIEIEKSPMTNSSEDHKFTWGSPVMVIKTAPPKFRPGELASVCGFYKILSQETAKELECNVGTWVYTTEFGDGSDMQIAECYLEAYEETSKESATFQPGVP